LRWPVAEIANVIILVRSCNRIQDLVRINASLSARNGLRRELIVENWDEFLRVAGSLKTGTVKPSELIRGLQRGNKISTLGRAIGELGRIRKTMHLLNYSSDATYRRHILTQLNRHESRNGLARHVFHGQKGELRQRYREGQEDQLGALGLVVNVLILWTTRYMNAALNHLRDSGYVVDPNDEKRLSPLGSKYFHVQLALGLGLKHLFPRYEFAELAQFRAQ
jgi:TnpA family transposase